MAAALTRAHNFLLKPADAAQWPEVEVAGEEGSTSVSVIGMSAGCGASTVAAGLELVSNSRLRATVQDGHSVAPDADAVVIITPGSGQPSIAALVGSLVKERVQNAFLIANRVSDEDRWRGYADLCLPDSRLGAVLVARGRRPPGSFGAALARLAALIARLRTESGQALVLLAGSALVLMFGLAVLGAFGRALLDRGRHQRAADLAAISAARSMRDDFARLFEPALDASGNQNPRHLEKSEYLARAREVAVEIAAANGASSPGVQVSFPDGQSFAPLRVRVRLDGSAPIRLSDAKRERNEIALKASAQAQLEPPSRPARPVAGSQPAIATGGGYSGPLAFRQGKPMRPEVARAFDVLQAAARGAGLALIITSAYRSDTEQARLYARHPDPRWVAPPGKSLHRNGTELDLGPPAAYGWLARNAGRFGFLKRYSWEPWHFGYVGGSTAPATDPVPADPPGDRPLPASVPPRYANLIAVAATRWNVPAELLAAQLFAESNFNPFARSPAGALGIAQFMPATARSYGLRNPFDASSSIEAQAHLMHDLLERFRSTALAIAAYNAGAGAVERYSGIPPYPETRAYVAKILGLLGGTVSQAVPETRLEVRLVS